MQPGAGMRGQNTVELVLLIAAVIAALTGLQLYLRYAVSGRLNEARLTILGDELPHYAETADSGTPMTRTFNLLMNETVTSTPFMANVTDPQGLPVREARFGYTSTVTFTESRTQSQ